IYEHRLGDLDREAARLQAEAIELGRDRPGEVEVDEVAHGQVDGDRQIDRAVAPLPALLEGGAQDMVGERADEARVLGEVDELVWPNQPPLGMLPADEGL